MPEGSEPKQSGSDVEVAVVYPHDEFVHGLKGVDPLTQEFTSVPRAKLADLRKVATASGVTISVRGE